MEAIIARYKSGDATPDDYLLLATDTLINGNFQLNNFDFLKEHVPDGMWAALNKVKKDHDQALSADTGLAPS